jgi:hypothetical protein
VFAFIGKPVGTGAQSMEPNSPSLQALQSTNVFSPIIGVAPTPLSFTEGALDVLISAFLPGQTVPSILNQVNDTIVPISSQSGGNPDAVTIPGIVHTNLCGVFGALCSDTGETASQTFWQQAYYWLTGGPGTAPSTGFTSSDS